jgi:hypothetical protein
MTGSRGWVSEDMTLDNDNGALESQILASFKNIIVNLRRDSMLYQHHWIKSNIIIRSCHLLQLLCSLSSPSSDHLIFHDEALGSTCRLSYEEHQVQCRTYLLSGKYDTKSEARAARYRTVEKPIQ